MKTKKYYHFSLLTNNSQCNFSRGFVVVEASVVLPTVVGEVGVRVLNEVVGGLTIVDEVWVICDEAAAFDVGRDAVTDSDVVCVDNTVELVTVENTLVV